MSEVWDFFVQAGLGQLRVCFIARLRIWGTKQKLTFFWTLRWRRRRLIRIFLFHDNSCFLYLWQSSSTSPLVPFTEYVTYLISKLFPDSSLSAYRLLPSSVAVTSYNNEYHWFYVFCVNHDIPWFKKCGFVVSIDA